MVDRRIRAAIVAGLCLAAGGGTGGRAATPAPVKFEVRDGGIPASLTGRPGDPEKGRRVVADRLLGNCLACHAISTLTAEPHQGNVGPSLDGVASRLSAAQLRLRIVDPSRLNPDTMMPAFYRVDGLTDVMRKFQGKPILSAGQVEDAIAFLETLK